MSIVSLERKLSSLSIQAKQDSFSSYLMSMSDEMNTLIRSLAQVSINKSSAETVKDSYDKKFEELKAKTYTQKNSLESLDLASSLPSEKTARSSLDYLDLSLSGFTTRENPLYDSLKPLEKKAQELQAKKLTDRLQEAFTLYVYPTLNIVAEADPEVLDQESKVHLPRLTSFFVKEKFNNVNYQSKLVARGGYGDVRQLLSENPNRIFALKTPLTFHHRQADDAIRSIRNEILCLLQIRHPTIISVSAVTEFDVCGTSFIMKFIEGRSLDKELGRLSYSHHSILAHAKELALAINYLHQHGLVHKDIKPKNIMINKDNQVVLLDLGLAQKKEHSQYFSGSAFYMAPELSLPSSISSGNEKLDVYAFGVTLYEVLSSGELPYPPNDKEEKGKYYSRIASKNFGKPCELKEIKKHLNRDQSILFSKRDPKGELTKILVKCLHGDPAHRPSMEQVIEMLERIEY